MQSIVLAGGCFWCLDAAYRQIGGVEASVCGYTGGTPENPTYESVVGGMTGHAESVKVTFDEAAISEKDILSIFWLLHDPTTLNRQGADVGTQYRSAIFYKDDTQRLLAEHSRDEAQTRWTQPIVTEISALGTFYEAENYHQNYFETHPERAYCQIVINPKLTKLRQHYATLLR